MIRCLICALLLLIASVACADPIVLLLLRMVRDQAIATSFEAGVSSLRQESTIPAPVYGFALPTPPIPKGTEEQRVRALIDENFLHLSGAQRDAVFAGMQKILDDPRLAQMKPQLVGEFTLKARAVREAYLSLDRLTYAEKRALALQAKDEFRRLPPVERKQLLEMLESGTLPVPRDLNELMLAEIGAIRPGR